MKDVKKDNKEASNKSSLVQAIISLLFGEPIYTEDCDGAIRSTRMRHIIVDGEQGTLK